MKIEIQPYEERHVPAVRAFNARMSAAGLKNHFPESPEPTWLPRREGRTLYQDYFLALEGEDVRGAYILKHQRFALNGEVVSVGTFHLPISEGLADKRYAIVGVQLMRDALSRQPLLYSLGLGGLERPLAQVLKAAGWSLWALPFYFRVVRAGPFLRNIAILRGTAIRRAALDLASWTGVGALAIHTVQALRTKPAPASRTATVARFDAWVDAIWEAGRASCALSAVRDHVDLDILYPEHDPRFIRLRVTRGGRDLGWAVGLCTSMEESKYFGRMRLGSIVDGFAAPGDVPTVVAAATRALASAGADLVVSNQSHRAWCAAFEGQGFRAGPSNFVLASSPKLTRRLEPFEQRKHEILFMRGDGDGPIHL